MAPLFKLRRLPTACAAALAVAVLWDLFFVTIGASPWRWVMLLPLAAVFLAPWVVTPLKMWRTRTPNPADYPTEPYELKRHPLSPVAAEWASRACRKLMADGFVPVDDVGRWLTGGKAIRMVMLDHAGEGVRAMVLAGAGAQPAVATDGALTFYTVLEDGRQIGVSNFSGPRTHATRPPHASARFPEIRDADVLLTAFRAFVASVAGDAPRTLPPGATAAEFMAANAGDHEEEMTALGWYRRAGEGCRWTLRGAVLANWYRLFPLRHLGVRAALREQDRVLKELGIRVKLWPSVTRKPKWWLTAGGVNAATVAALLMFGIVWPWMADRGGIVGMAPLLGRPDRVVPEPLPAGFAVPRDYDGAVAALSRLAGAPARPLEANDGYAGGDQVGMQVPVAKNRVDGLLATAQPAFAARGFVLLHTQDFSQLPADPDALALFPLGDAYDVLRKLNTNGGNYGIDPDRVVAWLHEVDREHPLTVNQAGFDFVGARFRDPVSPAEARALAARVTRFCPDVVTQGTGSVRALAAEIRKTQSLYCWWD
ncbi:MAG TPA: DUF4253 domain-containing protein [Longimicrobium sp.]